MQWQQGSATCATGNVRSARVEAGTERFEQMATQGSSERGANVRTVTGRRLLDPSIGQHGALTPCIGPHDDLLPGVRCRRDDTPPSSSALATLP